jgi:hypothetical protein
MDSHRESEVYRRTDEFCKEKVNMDLAIDMPINPVHDETVDYIP